MDDTGCIVPDTITIGEASKKIKNKHKILAIVDGANKITKVVSSADITNQLEDKEIRPADLLDSVTPKVKFTPLSKDDTVDEVIDFIVDHKVENTVISSEDGKFYGVLNKDKLIDAIEEIVD